MQHIHGYLNFGAMQCNQIHCMALHWLKNASYRVTGGGGKIKPKIGIVIQIFNVLVAIIIATI